ncbi:MAG: hypothetical protein U9Q90_11580, partial [Campylobacterota bacterium]|nr:hypothetical protein [Campylobacterota bacterium]
MFKTLFTVITFLMLSTTAITAAPPSPQTFVPNRGAVPKMVMLEDMEVNISGNVKKVVYVWNLDYAKPSLQIGDLMLIFKYLSNAPKRPKQMLMNKTYSMNTAIDTKKMIKALDNFQESINRTYRSLFEYASVIDGTKDGSLDKRYKAMYKDMKKMMNSYNKLVKVTNKQYRAKVLPFYQLDI